MSGEMGMTSRAKVRFHTSAREMMLDRGHIRLLHVIRSGITNLDLPGWRLQPPPFAPEARTTPRVSTCRGGTKKIEKMMQNGAF